MIFDETLLAKLNARLKEAIGNDVMGTARLLRIVRDTEPELLPKILETHGIGRRRALALQQIDRILSDAGIPNERLNMLGVARLTLIARHATSESIESLVSLAEMLRVHELEAHLRGEPVVPDARAMILRLPAAQDLRLRKLLKAFGAEGPLNSLARKEGALIGMMNALEVFLSIEPAEEIK